MTHRNNFFARLLRGMLKLLFGLAIAVFLFGLLLAVLVMMLGVTLGSLLTGRRPAPLAVFSQVRQTSQRYTQDVVDVQAHEVADTPKAPASK